MDKDKLAYHAFLLRLWAAPTDGKFICRASLEWVATGQRQGFDDLESLCTFLRQQTDIWLQELDNRGETLGHKQG